MRLFGGRERKTVSVMRRLDWRLWVGIEEIDGDKGFQVGTDWRHVPVFGAGYVSFEHGHESLVNDWCDVVSHVCFRWSCALSPLSGNVT